MDGGEKIFKKKEQTGVLSKNQISIHENSFVLLVDPMACWYLARGSWNVVYYRDVDLDSATGMRQSEQDSTRAIVAQ